MSKVLIVDDDEIYRRQLQIALRPDGHEIKVASNGRQAIELGTRYRPDVLVTDWMLKNHVHGLHVARALRAVTPQVRALLVTGFASNHLRAEANQTQVDDFIEKPFGLERLRSAVRGAGLRRKTAPGQSPLAVMEVDGAGSIVFRNHGARELLAETRAGQEAASLAEVFSVEDMPDLDQAVERWVAASPRSRQPTLWRLRSQPPSAGGTRLVVLRRQDDPQKVDLSLVEMLLGFRDVEHTLWPLEGRVLVIDGQALNRSLSVSLLESAGAGCYAVESPGEALRLLEKDEGLGYVIIDCGTSEIALDTAVKMIQAARPDIVIVGTSETDRRDRFARLGVEHFITKPWRVNDLINLLTGRIGNCVECALPLPLRRAQPGEAAQSWVCGVCGARYHAVLDDTFPPDVLQNVRPADPV